MIEMKKLMLPGMVGLTAFAAVAGSSVLNTLNASAATGTATSSTSSSKPVSTPPPAQTDPTQGGHVGANGTKEVLLTGDTATSAKAAAETAVPGGTVQRVENDAEGATYEAHVTKSDGTQLTVKLDGSFKVTSVDTDAGRPPARDSSTSN